MEKIYINIDESGSITKDLRNENRYFIIAMVITKDYQNFKKFVRREIKDNLPKELKKKLIEEKEVKGSQISETLKEKIYHKIIDDNVRIAYIIFDNVKSTDRIKQVPARAFNYLIELYFIYIFKKKDPFFKNVKEMEFYIDERNVKTKSINELEGYLDTRLRISNGYIDKVTVKYGDSKNYPLIQIADYLANTMYRNLINKNKKAVKNVEFLKEYMPKKILFKFPKK